MALMDSQRVTEHPEGFAQPHSSAGPTLALATVIVALGVRFFLLTWKYSINVFYDDQWDYLTPFFHHQPGFLELFFLQHGPHRQGLGLIADKFLFPLTRWNVRVDSFVVAGSIFAAMLLALQLKRKLFGPLAYSDVAIPVIFLTMAQYEIVVGAANPACAGLPLLLIMLYCLALLGRNRLQRYAFVLTLNFLLIYTGYGLFMGGVTLCIFVLECYWSLRRITSVPVVQPLTALTVAAASVASFFIHYILRPDTDCFQLPHRNLLQYPRFMALMFSAFVVPRPLYVSTTMTVLGGTILLAMLAILCWHLLHLLKHASEVEHLIGAVLLSYCLLFCATATIGRLCLGLYAAYSSRYSTLLIPAFLALYFFLLSKSWYGRKSYVLAAWILLLLPAAVYKPWKDVHWYADGKTAWVDCYKRTGNIHGCNQAANFAVFPHPEPADLQLQQKLDYLRQHHLSFFDKAGSE